MSIKRKAGWWCHLQYHPLRNAGHSREKLALSLPKGGNPVRGQRISEGLRSGFLPPRRDGNDCGLDRPCLANDTTSQSRCPVPQTLSPHSPFRHTGIPPARWRFLARADEEAPFNEGGTSPGVGVFTWVGYTRGGALSRDIVSTYRSPADLPTLAPLWRECYS
jgi:hypothetical protein